MLQNVLSNMKESDFDIALIDSGHGFPIPRIDYFYLAPHTKVSGLLIIDDVDIWSGRMIVEFLRNEPEWKYTTKLAGRTAIFREIAEFTSREGIDQLTVVRESRISRVSMGPSNGVACLLRGDFVGMRDRLQRYFTLHSSSKKRVALKGFAAAAGFAFRSSSGLPCSSVTSWQIYQGGATCLWQRWLQERF
jgi:hypothetical protein